MAVQKSQRSLKKKKIRKLKITNKLINKKITNNFKFKQKVTLLLL